MTIHPATAEDLLAAKKKGYAGDPAIDYLLTHGGAVTLKPAPGESRANLAANVRRAAEKRGMKLRIHFGPNGLVVVKA